MENGILFPFPIRLSSNPKQDFICKDQEYLRASGNGTFILVHSELIISVIEILCCGFSTGYAKKGLLFQGMGSILFFGIILRSKKSIKLSAKAPSYHY